MHLSYPKKLHIALILLIAILLAGLTGTLAWYGSTEAQLPQISGSVTYVAKYFESGDGTTPVKFDYSSEDDSGCAYEIKTAEQLYNLAWLQYLGYFNQPDENGVIPTTYFYLSADLDMSDYVLPPIGTMKYPFLGNFDGDGHTITGLTVTNKVNNTDTPIKDLPYIITQGDANYEVEDVEIIGLFGVVGTLNVPTTGSETDAACGSYTYSSITNEVKNLYISGLTVETQTSQSLIGIAAGYVNGTIENVGVIDAGIKIDGTVTALSYTSSLSDYSLVGYCTDAYRDTVDVVYVNQAEPVVELSRFQNQDSGDAWGGSISMVDLYDRLTQMYGKGGKFSYPTSETRVTTVDGVETVTQGTGTQEADWILSYYQDDTEDVYGGSAVFTYNSGGFYALYGEASIAYDKTVTRTTSSYVDVDAVFISNGTYYLTADTSSVVNEVATAEAASKWVIDANGYIFTYIDDVPYYLNRDDSNNLYISTTKSTVWQKKNSLIYFEDVNQDCYLVCDSAGVWSLSENVKENFITDGTNYLRYNNGLTNGTIDDATNWSFDVYNDGFRIHSGNVYLRNNNGLTTTNGTANASTWYIDEYGIYSLQNSNRYYLKYDGEWTVVENPFSNTGYFWIQGYSEDYYLSVDNGQVIATNDKASAVKWQYDATGKFLSTSIGGTTYYLNQSGNNTLVVSSSTSGRTAWTQGTNTFYYSSGRYYYYIECNNGEWIISRTRWQYQLSNKILIINEQLVNTTLAYLLAGDTSAGVEVLTLQDTSDTYINTTTVETVEASTYTTPDTFMPITTEKDESQNPTLAVAQNNTGYIVSGASSDQNANGEYQKAETSSGDIRVSSSYFQYRNLYYSNNGSTTYGNGSNLQIVTRTANSDGYVRISDGYNENSLGNVNATLASAFPNVYRYDSEQLDLKKYEESRKALITSLNTDNNYLYGLHFMNAAISKDNCATIPHAVINGQTYTNYSVPRSSIDFTLKEAGYINFFAGSYFTKNDSFFSLHEIKRNEDGTISSIRQIEKVYANIDTESTVKFIYEVKDSSDNVSYSDGFSSTAYSSSDCGQMLFDLAWIMNPGTKMLHQTGNTAANYYGALYYFEIPCNHGEYALGSVDGSVAGAYLIYLDISANSQEIQCQEITEVTTTTTNTYEYPKGLQVVASANSKPIDDTDSVAVALNDDNQTVEIKRENDTVTFSGAGTAVYKGDDLTLQDSDGNTMTVSPKSTFVVTEKKITRIEYNTTTKVTKTTVTTITETTENGELKDRTYQVTVDGVEQTATDDGTSVAGGTGILGYHYVLPKETTVVNTFVLPQLGANGLTTIVDTDYPKIGEEAVELVGKATAYAVTVTATKDISIKEDTISDGYTATLNGNPFTAGETIDVSP